MPHGNQKRSVIPEQKLLSIVSKQPSRQKEGLQIVWRGLFFSLLQMESGLKDAT
jgi:hypothetical protein